jgi:DNA invertase Pin-like site-specific DNA recombinase
MGTHAQDAIGYVRITEDPEDTREGVERQRQDLVELATRIKVNLIHIFEDNDITAAKVRRASTNWVKGVLWTLDERPDTWLLGARHDRLGRRLADLEDLHDHQENHPRFKVYTVADGDLFANPAWPFLAAQAKVEVMITRQRVQRQKEARRQRGLDGSVGRRPFGFEQNRETVIPEEKDAWLEAMSRIFAGDSTGSIARDFNRRGILRPYGGIWNSSAVRKTLMSRRYVGDLVHKGEIVAEGGAAWEAFVDREAYDRLCAKLTETSQPRTGGQPAKSENGGTAKCGICGVIMTGGKKSKAQGGTPMYRCDRGAGGCGRVSRNRSLVDQYVKDRLISELDSQEIERERKSLRDDLEKLLKEEHALKWKVDDAHGAYERDQLDAADYYQIIGRLRRRIKALTKAVTDTRIKLEFAERASAAEERWESWSIEERRAFIRSRVTAVVVKPVGKVGRRPANTKLSDDEITIIPRKREARNSLAAVLAS